jgi:hypothetical protein
LGSGRDGKLAQKAFRFRCRLNSINRRQIELKMLRLYRQRINFGAENT